MKTNQAIIEEIAAFEASLRKKYNKEITLTADIRRFSMHQLAEVINNYFKSTHPLSYPENGISNPTKSMQVVLFRQIFFKIARAERYSTSALGDFVGKEHSSVVTSTRQFEKLLMAKDKLAVETYEKVLIEVNNKIK